WASSANETFSDRVSVDSQLTGAFVVDPPRAAHDDRIFVLSQLVQDGDTHATPPVRDFEVWALNGKSWPYTERMFYPVRREIRWRIVNGSTLDHPMHLHGSFFRVDGVTTADRRVTFTRDGRPEVVTYLVPSSGTADISWTPERTGN